MRWNLLPAGQRADLLQALHVFTLWVYGEQRAYDEADLRKGQAIEGWTFAREIQVDPHLQSFM